MANGATRLGGVSSAVTIGFAVNDLSAAFGGPSLDSIGLGNSGPSNQQIFDLIQEVSRQLDDLSELITEGIDAIREDIDRLEINAVYDEASSILLGLGSEISPAVQQDILFKSQANLNRALNVADRLIGDQDTNASVVETVMATVLTAAYARQAAISAYSDVGFGELATASQFQRVADFFIDLFEPTTPDHLSTAPIYQIIDRSLSVETNLIFPSSSIGRSDNAERFLWLVTAELSGPFADAGLVRIWVDNNGTALAPLSTNGAKTVSRTATYDDGTSGGVYPDEVVGLTVTDVADARDTALDQANALDRTTFSSDIENLTTNYSLVNGLGNATISTLIGLNVEALQLDGFFEDAPEASGLFDAVNKFLQLASGQQLVGTSENDEISGGDSYDYIVGEAGNDTLRGGEENDALKGDAGNDLLIGGSDKDTLRGDAGNDTLYGGNNGSGDDKADRILGGTGGDEIWGEDGDDRLFGEDGRDQLFGGIGDDSLDGGIENDTLFGGSGDDYVSDEAGDNKLFGGAGDDTLFVERGNNTLSGGTGHDDITVGTGEDVILVKPGDGHDTVYGFNDGSTKIDLSAFDEADIADALAGISGEGVTLNLGSRTSITINGIDASQFSIDDIIVRAGVTTRIGSPGADTLLATPSTLKVFGRAGNDTLTGTEERDYLDGEDGNDQLFGNNGDDTLIGGSDSDSLFGEQGSDLLRGIGGNDFIDGGEDSDRIYGNAGNDTLLGSLGSDTVIGGAGDDEIYGGVNNDRLFGKEGRDTLYGGDHDDRLFGGDGNDRMFGGDGNDALFGNANADILNGENGDDALRGMGGNDRMNGGAGNDSLLGQTGQDIIHGNDDNDIVDGGAANDQLFGDAGNDTLFGRDGDDVIDGGTGDDIIIGHLGNDTLIGGLGNDTLTGNGGNDIFVFAIGDGSDTINAFTAGAGVRDVIQLSGFGTAFDTFAEIFAAATDDGSGNTVIDFGGGDTITLMGDEKADLNADDFVFI